MPAGLGGFLLFWNLNLGGGSVASTGPVSATLVDIDSVELVVGFDETVLFLDADNVELLIDGDQ